MVLCGSAQRIRGWPLVEFVSHDDPRDGTKRLREKVAIEHEEGQGGNTAALTRKLEAYLKGSRQAPDWVIDDVLMRSDFQRQVLQATREIPYGTLTTYLGLAERISQPKAVRAVAQALRYNPVPIQIPCHRIVGSKGSLTGYAGNKVALKRDILSVEGIRPSGQNQALLLSKSSSMSVGNRIRYFADRAAKLRREFGRGIVYSLLLAPGRRNWLCAVWRLPARPPAVTHGGRAILVLICGPVSLPGLSRGALFCTASSMDVLRLSLVVFLALCVGTACERPNGVSDSASARSPAASQSVPKDLQQTLEQLSQGLEAFDPEQVLAVYADDFISAPDGQSEALVRC